MFKKIAVLALFAAAAAAAAQAKDSPSFDCAKASNDVERTICANEQLAASDAAVAANYKQLLKYRTGKDSKVFKDEQRAWLKRRNQCGTNVACLSDAYDFRYSEMCTVTSGVSPCIN